MWRSRVAVLALASAVAVLSLAACGASTDRTSSHPASPNNTTPATAPVSSSAPSAVAETAPNPCRDNAHGQLVRVSLPQQHLWMCHGTRVVHTSAITSGIQGKYTHTPTGHYRIQALERNQTLTLLGGKQYQVKYWIPFDAPLFGFHDAPWQTFPFGSAKWHHHGSHGCVHMPTASIATLYHWAHVGTRVVIA